jgi:hypothetical protein
VTVSLKLWQVLALTVVAVLAVGLLLGRYAFPADQDPKYIAIDVGGAWGTVYFSDNAAAAEFKKRLGEIEKTFLSFRSRTDESTAQARVRAAIPAIEAYYADNNTYAGVALPYLQTTYDAGVEDITIQSATSTTYCIESTAGSETWMKSGPGSDIVSGSCP